MPCSNQICEISSLTFSLFSPSGKPLQSKTETSSDSDTDESVEVKTTKRVFIKTIETKDGKILSQKTEEKSGNLASTYKKC